MKRSSPSFHLLTATASAAAASAAASTTTMSSRTSFRGSRSWGRGLRSYSDRSSSDGRDSPQQFVSGDSHFWQVRDANRGFRPPYDRANRSSSNFPPSSSFGPPPNHYNPRLHQLESQQQQPRYGFNQQFRLRGLQQQQQQQHFRPPPPRPPKELEYRNWEYAKPGPPPECERFTILSYNILADYLARDHRQKLYFHIPSYMMDWQWRKRSIVFELGLWSADILCFQEVDRYSDLKEELGLRGYNSIWKMRSGDPVDGCAIFWRNSRFKLLQEESIEFNRLGLRDNVAQICVFESLSHCKDTDAAVPKGSLKQANKVVVCNIHVLFNPRRGEIKLGQIRVLLNRAHTVSKLWDDAPVIICGDFNSTPKSPLYNFVAEQKLDLSELPRDEVSGQASAEIYPSRPSNPHPGAQSTGNFSQASLAANMTRKTCDIPLAVEKKEYPDESSGNENSADTLSKPFSSEVQEPVESCIKKGFANEEIDKQLRENDLDIFNGINDENKSCIFISHCDLKKCTVALQGEAGSSVSPVKDVIQDPSLLDEKMEILSLNEILEETIEGEDNITFLSERNYTGGAFPSQYQRLNSEEDGLLRECAISHSEEVYPLGNEILDNPPGENPEIIHAEQSKYDPSAWTPVELEAATGSSDCVMMEHPLKLQSVYGEVEDCLGTRDSTGEPAVTSYHRRFFGTVDYIWRSEGLQTSKVLAPIPKHAMQWTRGFPTKKWGSDHIALVSELVFR
ncbi:hypothetical protein ACH5RR_041019 [Cinchona calisaya]|uniref:Endonuclease/exonuclease/phosphatase domain-containing protein n=1 Tax=Cinchona calisaya TaxID=153742 RepID=A0ABD2XXL0_9GENT